MVVIVYPDHDSHVLNMFQSTLRRNGWIISAQSVAFPDCDDLINGQCHIIPAVHNTTESNDVPIPLKTPTGSTVTAWFFYLDPLQ